MRTILETYWLTRPVSIACLIGTMLFYSCSQKQPATVKNPQAALIERTGLAEFGPESDKIASISIEDKNVALKMGDILKLAGDGKNASQIQNTITAITGLLQDYPDYSDAYALRASFLMMVGEPSNQQIRDDIDRALRYHSSKKYGQSNLSKAKLYAVRTKTDMLGQDYPQAIDDLGRAVKIDPSDVNQAFNTGGVRPGESHDPTVLEKSDYDLLISKNPTDYRVYLFRGLFYNSFSFYDEQYYAPAISDLNTAIALNSKSALGHYLLGRVYQKGGLFSKSAISSSTYKSKVNEKALQSFRKAIELDSTLASAYASAAEALSQLKQYPEAIKYYGKVIELTPSNAGAYNDRGLAQVAMQNYSEAISDFSEAIDLKKENSSFLDQTFTNRAEAYTKIGDHRSALNDYSKAIGIMLGNQVLLMSMSQIRAMYPEFHEISDQDLIEGLRQKFYPEFTTSDFAQSIQKNKDYEEFILADLYASRGDAYVYQGLFRKAVAEYARAGHMCKGIPTDRWKIIMKNPDSGYSIDIQTLDFELLSIVV